MSGFCGGSPPYAGGWDIRNQVNSIKQREPTRRATKKRYAVGKKRRGEMMREEIKGEREGRREGEGESRKWPVQGGTR